MPNEVKLLPCDPTPEMIVAAKAAVSGYPRDGALTTAWKSMWNAARPTTLVTDEVVERVARAISNAAWDNMRAQGFSGGWDHDELGQALARAALAVVTGEQPESGRP